MDQIKSHKPRLSNPTTLYIGPGMTWTVSTKAAHKGFTLRVSTNTLLNPFLSICFLGGSSHFFECVGKGASPLPPMKTVFSGPTLRDPYVLHHPPKFTMHQPHPQQMFTNEHSLNSSNL